MNDERGPWYLLTGLVLGAVIGLLYAWVIQPVQYTNTTPASLRTDFKDQYRALIAAAYLANGDLVRAKARLALLKDADVYRSLAEQAQRTLADGSSPEEARALGLLAVALGQPPPTVVESVTTTLSTLPLTQTLALTPNSTALVFTGTLTTPSITATLSLTTTAQSRPTRTPGATLTPSPTGTPLPTRTPTPTPGAPFVLKSQDSVCDPSLAEGLIQVETSDAAGNPVPGVEIVVTWDGGENHFFTGFKPELGLGYADFTMTPGITYTLRLAEGGQPISGLSAGECETADGKRYWGALRLQFEQP
jgi:hypothetical protein